MRRYQRLLILSIILVALAWQYLPVFFVTSQAWLRYFQSSNLSTLPTSINTSKVYTIRPKQWLQFAIPEGSQKLRIITNAHIDHTPSTSPAAEWQYALHYQTLRKDGSIIEDSVYYHNAHLTAYKGEKGNIFYGNYYADSSFIPLDGRLTLLGMQSLKETAFLRLSLETDNADIIETAVRVYAPAKVADHKLGKLWFRMSQVQKDYLVNASVYPSTLLSETEKINFLKNQWTPVGPLGIEGKNYRSQTLYILKDIELGRLDELIIPSGLQADNEHPVVIPIPEKGGKLSLQLKAIDSTTVTTELPIDLHWYGRAAKEQWQDHAVWKKDSDNLSYTVKGGWLEISPSSRVIINAFLENESGEKIDISPKPLATKTYFSADPVDFNLFHFKQQHAAIRIDIRQILAKGENPQQTEVDYQWLNQQSKIIAGGKLAALEQPSRYDQLSGVTEPMSVSDPKSYYLHIPANVTRLRLKSTKRNVLVNVYNQPFGFTKTHRIPEDIYVDNDREDWQLSWFPLKAINDKELSQRQSIQWINGQYRPPTDTSALLAADYLWQDYVPQANVEARYILINYVASELREEALPSIYCQMPVGHEFSANIKAYGGLRSVSPEFIYLRSNKGEFDFKLFIDQQKKIAGNSIGLQGNIHAPEIPAGHHQISLNSNGGGRWFMNYNAQCSGGRYIKRRVFALPSPVVSASQKNANNAELIFMVNHQHLQDEILSARFYSPNNALERSQITVKIEPVTQNAAMPAVLNNWTYTNRLYDIRPMQDTPMPILYTQGQTMKTTEFFVIPFNSDLPGGDYRIHIALKNGPSGYIALSQVKAGLYEQRRFFRETNVAAQ
ncbi:MAG: hypothetical protein HOP23_01115 [Methylococcaceae bacterium]|nr:hypothetical protein [Methylococcaceae bacterium]